MQELTKTEAY